ncbi:thioesterase family protein [Riemerella anatipestifer]|nr:thioesterase family protein [Riemerella anatipestifer]MDY3532701.1 thioesterase family protein [Riemerella anatipestifer]MDY3534744.1 thioesterase family protein [Riemerella anatipestifer]
MGELKEFESIVKIRFADCDPIGHLNNVKYLECMLNAREDHVEDNYGFTYQEYAQKTGCTWIAIENQIAYLREIRANTKAKITSKTIMMDKRTALVEILMKALDSDLVYAVLWVKVIHFNLKTRKSQEHTPEIMEQFGEFLVEISEKTFQERVDNLRKINKFVGI